MKKLLNILKVGTYGPSSYEVKTPLVGPDRFAIDAIIADKIVVDPLPVEKTEAERQYDEFEHSWRITEQPSGSWLLEREEPALFQDVFYKNWMQKFLGDSLEECMDFMWRSINPQVYLFDAEGNEIEE